MFLLKKGKGLWITIGCCGLLLLVLLSGVVAIPFAQLGQDAANVAQAALQLQQHIFGPEENEYHTDSFMQPIVAYWRTVCHTASGSLCPLAVSGNLQCVYFVAAAQWMVGNPLPALYNAQDFWPAYATMPGWQEIPSPSSFPHAAHQPPEPGDLMVWQGGEHREQQTNGTWQEVEDGHIAVITGVQLPSTGHNGLITLAQSNALPGASTVVLYPNYTVESWGGFTFNHISYGGETVLGYLRSTTSPLSTGGGGEDLAASQALPQGMTYSTPYVTAAWDDAEAAGISPHYFVAQIQQESGFHPQAQSSAGAVGIAQFLPATAASLGVNPYHPVSALQGAARLMASLTSEFNGNAAMALAAYNAGSGTVNTAIAQCGSTWLSCMPTETQTYVTTILAS
jgi:hypothetical protein